MLFVRVSKNEHSVERKRSVRIDMKREESGMVEHATINERMNKKVSRNLMTGFMVGEAGGRWRGAYNKT